MAKRAIAKMAAAAILNFKTFNFGHVKMSYVQKIDFQDGGRRHLEFLKFQFLVT